MRPRAVTFAQGLTAHKLGEVLGFPGRPLTALYVRFEHLARLPELPLERAGVCALHEPLLGVFISWQPQSVRRGDVDKFLVLKERQGVALMRACRQAGLKIVDNTALLPGQTCALSAAG